MNARTALGVVLCLTLAGCDDSKNPLSDAEAAKADERLVGVWQEENGGACYFIGNTGPTFPESVMRIVAIAQSTEKLDQPTEYLVYPTVLGDKTYLNLVIDEKQVQRLNKEGWKPDAVECYTFLKYQLDGDKLVVWLIDEKVKEQAIKDGKIKGVIEQNKAARFTDTTENIVRFVADAGDSLWDMHEPGRFDRAVITKKQ